MEFIIEIVVYHLIKHIFSEVKEFLMKCDACISLIAGLIWLTWQNHKQCEEGKYSQDYQI